MGRFRDSSGEGVGEAAIDMGPMMDCMFILLIFFIVTTSFVEEPGVDVDRPQAASARQLEKTSILIALTARGEVVYGGKDVGVGGVQLLVRRLLQKETELPVIIQADRQAPSGLLVRVVEEAKLGGAKRVNIATQRNKV